MSESDKSKEYDCNEGEEHAVLLCGDRLEGVIRVLGLTWDEKVYTTILASS